MRLRAVSERLVSLGLDVGTTSTQMVLSELVIENRAGSFAVPEMEIQERKILYKSPVYFTPLIRGELVDGEKIREIVDKEYEKAGISKAQVDTGAIIITGETSRKENARSVLDALAQYAGDFVVATAGPDLESVLAAKGAGAVEASERTGKRVLHFDIGGGTSEIACISLGGIVCSESIDIAGDVFTNDIMEYVRQQHSVRIGERTAEEIKCKIGAAVPELEDEPEDYVVTGPSMLTGLPQTITLSYNEIAYALDKSLVKLDAALMKVLQEMPAELYTDVVRNGIYLAGGGALIKGLDRRLSKKTGIPFHIAEDPLRAVVRGTNIALKNINRFSFLMR